LIREREAHFCLLVGEAASPKLRLVKAPFHPFFQKKEKRKSEKKKTFIFIKFGTN
jgi:hypothetical protein